MFTVNSVLLYSKRVLRKQGGGEKNFKSNNRRKSLLLNGKLDNLIGSSHCNNLCSKCSTTERNDDEIKDHWVSQVQQKPIFMRFAIENSLKLSIILIKHFYISLVSFFSY